MASIAVGSAIPTSDGTRSTAHDGGLKKVWSIPSTGNGDAPMGRWLIGALLVRGSSKGGVRAYNTTDGSEVYRVNPGASGSVLCAMSATVSRNGIGTVAFGNDSGSCTRLAGVDAHSGRVLWSIPLVSTRQGAVLESVRTYIQGDIATFIGEGILGGVDVATGRHVWDYKPRGSDCAVYGWAATSGAVLVDDGCVDTSAQITLSALDGRTGRRLWQRPEKAHIDLGQVFTADPLTATLQESGGLTLRRFDSNGDSIRIDTSNLNEGVSNGFPGEQDAHVTGSALIVPTRNTSDVHGVTAFDRTTGAQLWTYTGDSHTGATLVDTSGDGRLYAVSAGSPASVPYLVRLDPATGHSTPLSPLPSGTDNWASFLGTVYALPGGGIVQVSALNDATAVIAYR